MIFLFTNKFNWFNSLIKKETIRPIEYVFSQTNQQYISFSAFNGYSMQKAQTYIWSRSQ